MYLINIEYAPYTGIREMCLFYTIPLGYITCKFCKYKLAHFILDSFTFYTLSALCIVHVYIADCILNCYISIIYIWYNYTFE